MESREEDAVTRGDERESEREAEEPAAEADMGEKRRKPEALVVVEESPEELVPDTPLSMWSTYSITAHEMAQAEQNKETGEKRINVRLRLLFEAMIIANAFQIGVCAEQNDFYACYGVEHCFAFLFAVEAGVKAYILRESYWNNWWHRLDMAVTAWSLFNAWIFVPIVLVSGLRKDGANDTLNLIMRLMKIVSLLRVIRLLKNRKHLFLILQGLWSAFRALFWVGVLVALLVYCGAVFCVTAFKHDVAPELETSPWAKTTSAIFELVSISIIPEFRDEQVLFLTHRHWFAVVFFSAFAVIANLALLNLCIGVICESIVNVMQQQREKVQEDQEKAHYKQVKDVSKLMFRSRKDRVTRSQMKKFHKNHKDEVDNLTSKVNFPRGFKFHDLHTIFDRDGTGTITRDEFLVGMHRIVFCDTVQRTVTSQQTMAELMKEVKRAELNIINEMRKGFAQMKKESAPPQIGFKHYCEKMRAPPSDTESSEDEARKLLFGFEHSDSALVALRCRTSTSVRSGQESLVEDILLDAKGIVNDLRAPLEEHARSVIEEAAKRGCEGSPGFKGVPDDLVATFLSEMNENLTKAVHDHLITNRTDSMFSYRNDSLRSRDRASPTSSTRSNAENVDREGTARTRTGTNGEEQDYFTEAIEI